MFDFQTHLERLQASILSGISVDLLQSSPFDAALSYQKQLRVDVDSLEYELVLDTIIKEFAILMDAYWASTPVLKELLGTFRIPD